MCESADVVADIGCDHGRTVVELLQRNTAVRAIAADISPASLEKAQTLCERTGLDVRTEFLCGDGLSVLKPGYSGGIVISGMGGHTICEIITNANHLHDSVAYFVLSPNTHPEILRQTLFDMGFYIANECVVKENAKFYHVILAKRGIAERYTPAEMFLGKKNFSSEYTAHQIRILDRSVGYNPHNTQNVRLLADMKKYFEENHDG